MLTTEKLMLVQPKTVSPQTSILEAKFLMESEGTLQLPVLEGDKLVGIITDHDICLAIHAPAENKQSVADFMTADPIAVSPETPVFRTAQILSAYKFGALPVVEDEKLVGLITASLLLAYFASNLDQ
jgi:CBS domain-containing protein